ncbi:MAG: hypothetical protein E6J75_15950 [Deltaproteobacteria bacterium]|nr:MAG: hypothetical protein E6J75_15950 [Deltaproteobacteria bacterium]
MTASGVTSLDQRRSAETPVKGGCWQWESIKATWRRALEAGEIAIVLQIAPNETLRDPEFAAEAKRAKLEVDPIGGEETDRLVQDLFTLDPALAGKLRGTLR